MEQFEALIDKYPDDASVKDFTKVIDTVKEVLKEDLAPFEIDWILECIFYGKVHLPTVLSEKRRDDVWSVVISETFILLGELATQHTQYLEPYSDQIGEICLLVYVPHVRKRAIQCLTQTVSSGLQCVLQIPTLLNILMNTDEPLSCRVPLAELIGALCDCRPEIVGELYRDIWRAYLCVLEASKITDSLINGVLTGLHGLLNNFGTDITVFELNNVYENMVSSYIHKKSCEKSTIKLIASHAALYPEKIIADKFIVCHLWKLLEKERNEDVTNALASIYHVLIESFERDKVNTIITADLNPKTFSSVSQIKNTAYKILSEVIGRHKSLIAEEFLQKYKKNVMKIEFELQQKFESVVIVDKFEYNHDLVQSMKQASWIVVNEYTGSDSLLRLLLMLYRQCAPAERRPIVVHTLLNTTTQLRAGAVSFLIGECCQPPSDPDLPKSENMGKHLPIWRDLFNSLNGKDKVVLERSKDIFEDVLNYLIFFLETILNKEFSGPKEETRNKLSMLLHFSSQIIQLENVKEWMAPHVLYVLECTLESIQLYGMNEGSILFLTELLDDTEINIEDEIVTKALQRYYDNLRIDRCSDEALVCVSCLALVQAPVSLIGNISSALNAYKLLFSRSDVESKVLLKALNKFDNLLENVKMDVPVADMLEILFLLERLRTKEWNDKDGRIFRRHLVLFIGKYGANNDVKNNLKSNEVTLKSIKESIFFNLPNYNDGANYKINLQSMLDLALKQEDAETLHSLLIIMCSNSENLKRNSSTESVLITIVHKMCRCWCRGEGFGKMEVLEHAVLLFDSTLCVTSFIRCIISETSPGVRAMLSNILESVLEADPLSDGTQDAVRMLIEHTNLMLQTTNSTTKHAGLDLTLTVVAALKNNNTLTKEYLLEIIILTAKTNEVDFYTTFDKVVEYFFEIIELFDDEPLKEVCVELWKNLLEVKYDEYVYPLLLEKCLKVIHNIFSVRMIDFEEIFEMFSKYFDSSACDDKVYFAKTIAVLSRVKDIFSLDVGFSTKVIQYQDFFVLSRSLTWSESFYSKSSDTETYFLFYSLFDMLEQYADVLLDYKYQNTLELLSIMITTTPVAYVKSNYKIVESCLKKYRSLWKSSQPHTITNSIHMWFKSLPISNITDQLQSGNVTTEYIKAINAIKLMLNIVHLDKTEAIFADDIYEKIKSWSQCILIIHTKSIKHLDRSKMAALVDAMSISLFFMRNSEIIDLILEGQNISTNGMTFCQIYMESFAPYLLNSRILSDDKIEPYLSLFLLHLIRYYSNKKSDSCANVRIFDLVNQYYWTIISESQVPTPLQILEALNNVGHDGLHIDSECGTWLLNRLANDNIDLTKKIKYMEVLPPFLVKSEDSPLLNSAMKSYCSALPSRLYELETRSEPKAFTAALNALAVSGNVKLMDCVIKFTVGADTEGWWDTAIEQCMSQLANKSDMNIALYLYKAVKKCQLLNTNICSQLLVPLLRYSSQNFNEEFFTQSIEELLRTFNRTIKNADESFVYMNMLIQYTNAFHLLQVMFEKVSSSSLESPKSVLNAVNKVCKICLDSRNVPASGASDRSKEIYRKFQCASYNCMAAALSKRKPNLKFYEKLFSEDVWPLIVAPSKNYVFHIDGPGFQTNSTKRHMVSVETDSEANLNLSLRNSLTSRPLFLRTLSDNPLQYDLFDDQTTCDNIQTQELILVDNELNAHECSATLSAILCHLSSLTEDRQPYWINMLASILTNEDTSRNIKWFLCQVIINCKDVMQTYKDVLSPALFTVVSTTPYDEDHKKYLNGLHINILKIVLHWSSLAEGAFTADRDVLTRCFDLLLDTCYYHKYRKNVTKTLINVLSDLIKNYNDCLSVTWERFKDGFEDPSLQEINLKIVLLLSRNKIYIADLLPNIVKSLQQYEKVQSRIKEISEVFGLAAAICKTEHVRHSMGKFRNILDKIRQKDVNMYVKVLYYAHVGYAQCVDESNFSTITYLARKMTSANKDKCYNIIATYISNVAEQTEEVTDMFDSINITEMILDKNSHVAVNIVKSGLHLMSQSLRMRSMFLVCDLCANYSTKTRKVAYELIINAFKETMSTQEFKEPPSKRMRSATPPTPTSRVLQCLLSDEIYIGRLLSMLGRGLMDSETSIREMVYNGILDILNKKDLALRFCEIIAVTMVLPSEKKFAGQSAQSGNTANVTSPVEATRCFVNIIKLWCHVLRDDEHYKRKLLRDEPLEYPSISQYTTGPSKLLTMSKTYQGTFRTTVPLTKLSRKKRRVEVEAKINIQVPIDDIFNAFIKFSGKSLNTSAALLLEIFKIVTGLENFAQLEETAAKMLYSLLETDRISVVTPTVMQMASLIVKECVNVGGFLSSVENLYKKLRRSEGEQLTRLLYEEAILHSNNYQELSQELNINEFPSNTIYNEFSIQDLTSIFGKLSNWDELTLQQRAEIKDSPMPVFWTSEQDILINSLDQYEDADSWVNRLYSVHKGTNNDQHYKWLRDIDVWPRRPFTVSVVTEAIQIHTKRSEDVDFFSRLPSVIRQSDCLAEWAVRLMIRSLIVKSMELEASTPTGSTISRQQEIKWCAEANRRGLSTLAHKCIQRNTSDLLNSEALQWFLQDIHAARNTGLDLEDYSVLNGKLEKAEKSISRFKSNTDFVTLARMNEVMLLLNYDVKGLTDYKIKEYLNNICEEFDSINTDSSEFLPIIANANKIAFEYYCDTLDDCEEAEALHLFQNASTYLSNIIKYNKSSNIDRYIATILTKLEKVTDEDVYVKAAMCILNKLEESSLNFEDCILVELERIKAKIPASKLESCPKLNILLSGYSTNMNKYSMLLQLLRSPEYTLQQYCAALLDAVSKHESTSWNNITEAIYTKLFDKEHSGSAYQLLFKYKTHFDNIKKYQSSQNFKQNAQKTLGNILRNLANKEVKSVISLDDLCPTLANYRDGAHERDARCLNTLLHVDAGLSIVRFDKQIQIFTNSIKRPVLVRALLSNGRMKGFLIKTGEDMRIDAACQEIQRHFNHVSPYKCVTYKVTALGEDAGVIEFLEDHQTIRSLLAKTYTSLNGIGAGRIRDEELILQQTNTSLAHFTSLCKAIPVYALRNCISNECESVEDFISKKRAFLDTISAMTISHWILGLGDRHLENLLYSKATGSLCAVDWGAALHSAVVTASPEIQPARLTRILIAVDCNRPLLESRLQSVLCALRSNVKWLSPVINVAFKWEPNYDSSDFQNKLTTMECKLRGAVLPHQVTRDILSKSNVKHKDKYIELLNNVFDDCMEQPIYSIQEQVTCLIKQCTDMKILAVTRSGWEPWL